MSIIDLNEPGKELLLTGNEAICVGCGICAEICPEEAVVKEEAR